MKKRSTSAADAPRDSKVFGDFSEQNRVGRGITTAVVIFGVIVLLALFFAVILHMFFRVETIVIDGVDHYGYERILEVAKVAKGDSIFTFSEKKLADRLKSGLPYVKEVEVELDFPSSVHILLTEEVPSYYFEMDGEFFLITDEMKVLDGYTSEKALLDDIRDVMRVEIPTVSRAISGDKVKFVSEFDSKHTDDVLSLLNKWERYAKLSEIDLSNRFELRLVYEDRFTLELGSYTDLDEKLRLAESMIDHYSDTTRGTLVLSDVERGIAQIEDEDE